MGVEASLPLSQEDSIVIVVAIDLETGQWENAQHQLAVVQPFQAVTLLKVQVAEPQWLSKCLCLSKWPAGEAAQFIPWS